MPQSAPEPAGITPGQIKMIHAAKRMLGLDDDTYRDMLENIAGVRSATELDQDGVTKVIRHLSRCGFKVRHTDTRRHKGCQPRATRPAGKVVALASAEQLDKIAALAGLIQWRSANGHELWMKKRMGITRVRTDEEAFRVTEGLKKMFEHQMEAKHGQDWWAMIFTDRAIMAYIKEHCPAKYKDHPGIVLRGLPHA